ncbi:MAG: alkaline phosphatase family protein [Acidobacteriota bacterium]
MIRSAIRLAALCAAALLAVPGAPAQSKTKTRKVIFVMTDGLRWQEVFQGADAALMNKEAGGVIDVEGLKKGYWRESPEERRAALMPFLWSVIARQGQIYGNREAAAEAYVTNGMNFSYPGYNETLTGFGDPKIDSNDKKYNANVTLLEWLNGKSGYKGKVAAFGAWDTFPWIFNAPRAGFPVNTAYDPMSMSPMTPAMELLNQLKAEAPRDVAGESHDIYPFHTALEYWRVKKPSVMYLSLGETDHWAHVGNYTEYLRSARRVDEYVKRLWEEAQKHSEYRGVTTLVLSVDHGRGEAPVTWKSHGQKLPQSKYIWMAFLGPDTKPLGERKNIPAVTQSQIAATIATLLGEDYNAAEPRAGKPIADIVK